MNLNISDVVMALQQLKYDGMLTEDGRLTALGSSQIFTPNIFQLKLKILNEISRQQHKLNHHINLDYFLLKYKAYKEVNAGRHLKFAVDELVAEGSLIECNDGKYKGILPSEV